MTVGPLRLNMAFSGCPGGYGHCDEDRRNFRTGEIEQASYGMAEPDWEGIEETPRVGHEQAELRAVHALEDEQRCGRHERQQREFLLIFKAREPTGEKEYPVCVHLPRPKPCDDLFCRSACHAWGGSSLRAVSPWECHSRARMA